MGLKQHYVIIIIIIIINCYYSQARSSVPPRIPLINKFFYSKVESVGSCRFQIHLYILAWVMSREFTRDSVMKFLPA